MQRTSITPTTFLLLAKKTVKIFSTWRLKTAPFSFSPVADLQSLPMYSSATLATVSLDLARSLLSPSLAKVEINSKWEDTSFEEMVEA